MKTARYTRKLSIKILILYSNFFSQEHQIFTNVRRFECFAYWEPDFKSRKLSCAGKRAVIISSPNFLPVGLWILGRT